MTLKFSVNSSDAIATYVCTPDTLDDLLATLPPAAATWAHAQGFKGAYGQAITIPSEQGAITCAVLGLGDEEARKRSRFHLASAAVNLPAGVYSLANELPLDAPEYEVLGWLLLGYAFDKYAHHPVKERGLVAPDWIDVTKIEAIANAEALCRDLVNTPTSDLGPDALEKAVRDLATAHGASIDVITGDDLLEQNFPLIHTVGRASVTAPRLIDMRYGTTGPKLTLVGKGVCFDTGGLNLKSGASMGTMKKDMGGAANTIALAHMIMALNVPVQLRLLIPAVENSVSGNSFRPSDILTSRLGKTVEINNTDAEGRLVLADALTYASEEDPDLIISMATLTGAARVAVGPDLAPFFAGRDQDAQAIMNGGKASLDPVWRMPFHDPYEHLIEPGIADLDNAPSGGMAGSITAALFLRRFVKNQDAYMHFDIFSWQPVAKPARSKGGFMQGPRAILTALSDILGV